MSKTGLYFRIDTSSGVPIYLQLINQVKYHIATGALQQDDELPSVRTVAEQYMVNPNTISKAYRALEQEGVIYRRRGMGTYVSGKMVEMSLDEKIAIVRELLEKAVIQGRQLGMSSTSIRATFEKTMKKFPRQK